ncbi:DUF599 domain-containing protein [Paracraurococcus ruber]|uniref:DUF599 domain-containing protein n=1 Tax=Paracraurococcus ruber TaxID=77675 RepID=A0ABS1D3M6_9PROT|nr:DUF599 domain-containing protein [Paracraurococcus ruber]MBK1661045.1 hypothetical protein [Paracraurococcus ruber]TDG29660.1 DUF599 domain-containing protein [Paracraurococcus ruber]
MHSLTLLDWLALAVFAASWVGYSTLVDRHPRLRARSVIAAMDDHRRRWLRTTVTRDNRIMDTNIIGNLMNSTSFLANTAIFILGGLVAMMGSPELGARVFGALPFAATPDPAAWEMKVALLLLIFVRAFFELTWALRQFNYCSIVIGGIPQDPGSAGSLAQAEMAAKVANRAARHFNTGLRAYYFGLAALGWILHPLLLVLASLWVVQELYRREFRSVVREALREG